MTVTDSLANAFVKIKNAYRAGQKTVEIKSSRMLLQIMEILKNKGFIQDYKFIEDNRQGIIRVYLKYLKGRKPAMVDIKRVSKPGRRIYVNKSEIPRVLSGIGIAIITTSRGLLTDEEAEKLNAGGEVICYVY